jgi:hypothetical protein
MIINPYRFGNGVPLISFISAGANAGGDTSIVTIDTTGADLLVASGNYFTSSGAGTLTDGYSNTWTALTPRDTGGGVGGTNQMYYCLNPVVGSGHSFTWARPSIFGSLAVSAYHGVKLTSAFDLENGASSASATTLQPGSITPSEDNEVLVTSLLNIGTFSTPSIDSGFTIRAYASGGGSYFDVAIADLIQSSAGAANPTWTSTASSQRMAAEIASFKHS